MRSDRGSATVELAVALPAVMVLLLAGVAAVVAVIVKLGCIATARDSALAVARGERLSEVDGLSLSRQSGVVTVTVTRSVTTCRATAAMEPGQA